MGDGKFFHSDGQEKNTTPSVGESLFVRVHKEGDSHLQEKAQFTGAVMTLDPGFMLGQCVA